MNIEIKYDGEYPNLCSGKLIAIVDGFTWVFPDHCMVAGGTVGFNDDWDDYVTQGDWDISNWPLLFPEELKQPVIDAVNEQVEHGNCGGCL